MVPDKRRDVTYSEYDDGAKGSDVTVVYRNHLQNYNGRLAGSDGNMRRYHDVSYYGNGAKRADDYGTQNAGLSR